MITTLFITPNKTCIPISIFIITILEVIGKFHSIALHVLWKKRVFGK